MSTEKDVTLTEDERRKVAWVFHGTQWLSPERAACVEQIIAARLAHVSPAAACCETCGGAAVGGVCTSGSYAPHPPTIHVLPPAKGDA